MRGKKSCYIILLLLFSSRWAIGQESAAIDRPDALISLSLNPGLSLPLGGSAKLFTIGAELGISGQYKLPFFPLLFLSADLGYALAPIQVTTQLSILEAGAGIGVDFEIVPRLHILGNGKAGYFYAFLNNGAGTGHNPYLYMGTGIFYDFLPSISLGAAGYYRNYLGLYNDLLLSLIATYHLQPLARRRIEAKEEPPSKPKPLEEKKPAEPVKKKGSGVEVTSVSFENIFPVFFKYYDTHSIGKAALTNWEKEPAEDIKVSFFVKQYMDNPQASMAPATLKPGESAEAELRGLFTNRVMEITEGEKVSATIIVEYTLKGKRVTKEFPQSMRLFGRNNITWDDDRKASAFVTARDSGVLKFAKNVASAIEGKGSRSVNPKLLTAIALHHALSLYGMSYVIDPTTPYSEFSKEKLAVDFLQFPRETLEFKAGDCDDLSILYCALLESVGVETAFITVPGHIFMAFSLDIKPDEARRKFLKPDELILREDGAWVPVEVTETKGGFLRAWQSGAKSWRENEARGQADFYPMHASWAIYEPVGYTGEKGEITLPSQDSLVNSYLQEVVKFIDREIYPQVARLQAEIQKSQESSRAVNKLGVLYASYGLDDRAEREFNKILKKEEYVPALLNLGNIYFLRNEMKIALTYYERAYRKDSSNPKVLLCMSRVSHELENYGTVREAYGKLKDLDPELAARFSYLDFRGEEAARAAAIGQIKGVVLWDE